MSIRRFAQSGAVAAGALALAALAGAFTTTAAQPLSAARAASIARTGSAPRALSAPRTTGRDALAAGHAQSHSARVVQPGGPLSITHSASGKGFTANGGNLQSRNWGGFASQRRGVRFRSISSTFFVPYVNCATAGTYSGHWVGLDGLANSTVEQDGILAACNGNSPLYQAWWEMFPKVPVYPHMTIRAGNSITATVAYHSGKFTLSVSDTTNGQHFRVSEDCPAGSTCARGSAEVISEAPSNGTSVLPLTDFRAESFTNIAITSTGGRAGGLRARWWDTEGITTVNGSGTVLDQPTSIYRGSTFDMYWLRST